jgi:ribonuclease D
MDERALSAPIWVDTSLGLQNAMEKILHQPIIAVDTESDSLFVYQEKVCLIQISTPQIDFLIDPLAIRDLSPLGPVFADRKIEKIFHASEYDLICLKRDYHFEFHNIFDTMIAARILGETEIGLGSLLNSKLGVVLDKRFQRANWGIRPLSEAMVDYARLDTHYLFHLREILAQDLSDKNLYSVAQEDFLQACKASGHKPESRHNGCWKVAGSNKIDPQQAALLQQLCIYRDEQAQKADLPHFKVLSNQLLLDLSLAAPETLETMKEVSGVTEKILHRHGSGLLRAIKIGINSPPIYKQDHSRPDLHFIRRLELLKEWRKTKAKELKVESDIVLPKEILERIAARNPRNLEELTALMADTPSRLKNFGSLILEKLSKESTNEDHI